MSVLLLTMGPRLGLSMSLTPLVKGEPGTITFSAVGATGLPIYALVNSDLPPEWDSSLTLVDNTAQLSTAEARIGGYYDITVRVSDAARIPVVRTFTVFVFEPPPLDLNLRLPWAQTTNSDLNLTRGW